LRGDGSEAGEDESGEIVISAPFLFSGYNHLPEMTRSKLVDGELRSGDEGFILGGALYVLGRKDDTLIVNGRNYYAHEIEHFLSRREGLRAGRSVAFSIYNPAIGSDGLVVVCEAQPGSGADAKNLSKTLKRDIFSAFGVSVAHVHVVAPGWTVKTTSGKISRKENKLKYLRQIGAVA